MKKLLFLSVIVIVSVCVKAQLLDVSVYSDCSKNGYTRRVAEVLSTSGRTSCDYVQLWAGGPKWATFNVGATITNYEQLTVGADAIMCLDEWWLPNPSPYYNTANVGGLYAWNNPNLNGRKTTWDENVSTGISDVATTLWGSNWQTPTKEQLDTLLNSNYGKTTWIWCFQYVAGCTSFNGYKVSGVGDYAGYSIFLPAAGLFNFYDGRVDNASGTGYYWSSKRNDSDSAYYLCFYSDNRYMDYDYCGSGFSVRAVLADDVSKTPTNNNVKLTLNANSCEAANTITCPRGHLIRITAEVDYGYTFDRWSDGNTDNPRQVTITQDTSFMAIFQPVTSGKCGDNVIWSFDTITKIITLDGSGDTYEMDTMELAGRILPPWTHLNNDIDSIVVKQNVGLVRGNAFYYCKNASAVYDYRWHIGQNLIYAPFVKDWWDWWQPDTTQNYHIICFADGYYLDSIGLMRDLFVPSVIILETDTTIGRVEILEHETECGGSALIAAYPLDSIKYRFSRWSDGNKNAVRELSTHDYWGNLDTVSATAFFELNQYSVNFNATDGGYVDKEPCYLMYMDTIRFSAMPYYGYHFDKWSDGVATSSRIEVVRQDTQYTAIFARDTFTITTQANNAEWGKTYGDTSVLYYHMVTIYAESNYGYHFDHWMDGSTDSYRNVKVDSNKVYIAIFAPDARYVNISCNEGGNVEGDINPYRTHLDTITFTAVPQYGYHFVQWSDGVTAATRTEIVKQDTSYYAIFAKNLYHVSVQWNSEYGSVTGDTCGLYEYQTNFKTIITPKYAYWAHDGKSYYPFEFTQYTTIISDTTIIIDFQPMQGKYGKNVTWTLGTDSVLRFTGSGDMYNTKNTNIGWGAITKTIKKGIVSEGITSVGFYAFGGCTTMTSVELPSSVTLLAGSAFSCCESLKEIAIPGNVTSIESDAFYDCQSLTSVTIPNEVQSIGSYAFAGCGKLTSIIFGSKLSSIGAYAFKDCYYVDNMTIFAETPPTVESTTFASLSKYAYLNVPSGSLRAYQMALYWRDFLVQVIGAEPIPTVDDVQVDVSSVSVTITWPKNGKAGSYTIEIKKDGRVIFALTFNAQGQLINITFAPGRGINNNVDAIAVEGGFRFTITSLNPGTTYTYSIDTKDEEGTSIRTDTGAFTTTGETPTGMNEVDSQKSKVESQKILRNGVLLIERNGVYYNAQGTVVE